jgi:cyanuric acid amidohydrolase
MQTIDVLRIPTKGPGDVSGLSQLIQQEVINPSEIIAVLGKTEGNGCVNDFTREYSTAALATFLAGFLRITPDEVERRIAFVMSGGTEGVLSPHLTVFCRKEISEGKTSEKRLAIGIGFTRDFLPEELGRMAQVRESAAAVRAAMKDGGIESAADVHFVQIKCPLLTSALIDEARRRGKETVCHDTYESMGYSRGASALGVGLELKEISEFPEDAILRDWSLYSGVASTSAGIELAHNVVIVMGMSATSASPYKIAHGVMKDAIDGDAVSLVLHELNVGKDQVINAFAKAEAAPDGTVRGLRHTMLNDSDINSTRHARAAVGAVVASVIGTTAVYVSGGAEHQGPPGGGPVAIVARA